MSEKYLRIKLTDEREKMLDILASEFTKFYNNFGIPFGGSQDIRNATILRLVLEGFRKYGFTRSDDQLYFDQDVFYKALKYEPDKMSHSIEDFQQ